MTPPRPIKLHPVTAEAANAKPYGKGNVYIAYNKSFRPKGVLKIGLHWKTDDPLSRKLDTSSHCDGFDILYSVPTSQAKPLENVVHELLSNVRYIGTNSSTEFFSVHLNVAKFVLIRAKDAVEQYWAKLPQTESMFV